MKRRVEATVTYGGGTYSWVVWGCPCRAWAVEFRTWDAAMDHAATCRAANDTDGVPVPPDPAEPLAMAKNGGSGAS